MADIQNAVIAAAGLPAPSGGPQLELWASCPGGCEQEAAAELAAFGWRPAPAPRPATADQGETAGLPWERGAVYGTTDLAGVERALLAARTITRLTWLTATAMVDELDDIAAVVRDAGLPDLPDAPFAVAPERHGSHPFGSPDIGRVAGDAVIAAHRARTGRRLPVDLDSPEVVVRVELTGRRLRVGCELTRGSLHRRAYLPRRHRAGLNPVLAAALLVLGGWRADERLLDPMCGAGTIPVEAARAACRLPPRCPDHPDRLAALGLRRAELRRDVAAALADHALAPATRIVGHDRDPRQVATAEANADAAGVASQVTLGRADATAPLGLPAVDVAVANPPYGIRTGSLRGLADLYEPAMARVAERLTPGGRVVWLTPATGVAERAARAAGLHPDGRRTIGLGTFDASACRFTH